jgi:antitoxin MazE
MAYRSKIVRIGNSQGVRIPRFMLEESGITGDVEMDVENGEIIIRAVRGLREGWSEAFEAMAARGDDVLLDDTTASSEWDLDEWEWA